MAITLPAPKALPPPPPCLSNYQGKRRGSRRIRCRSAQKSRLCWRRVASSSSGSWMPVALHRGPPPPLPQVVVLPWQSRRPNQMRVGAGFCSLVAAFPFDGIGTVEIIVLLVNWSFYLFFQLSYRNATIKAVPHHILQSCHRPERAQLPPTLPVSQVPVVRSSFQWGRKKGN